MAMLTETGLISALLRPGVYSCGSYRLDVNVWVEKNESSTKLWGKFELTYHHGVVASTHALK